MGYRQCLASAVAVSESGLPGALSRASCAATSWPKELPYAGVEHNCRKSSSMHWRVFGSHVLEHRIDCSWVATALQRRALSIDKERRWAVSAAAVTLSKRRNQKNITEEAGSFPEMAANLQPVINECPPAGSDAGAAANSGVIAWPQQQDFLLHASPSYCLCLLLSESQNRHRSVQIC
jgi:hypothetical protein